MTTTTPIRWKELSARERDALIQEHVFAKCTHGTPDDWEYEGPVGDMELACKLCRQSPDISKYSTDISAAFQVVEKMREKGFDCVLDLDADTGVWCVVFLGVDTSASCETSTAPESICLAALTAIGMTIERE